MIPRISLLLLLAGSAAAMAQPLYKWVESDGSITFSPKPPGAGISYERVDSASSAAPRPAVATSPAVDASRAESTGIARSPVSPADPLPRVQYAPGNAGDLPPAISRSRKEAGNGSSLMPSSSALAVGKPGLDTEQGRQADERLAASMSAANFKRSRCQDLKKRVTSLEHRLKSRLTPEDMDNTVVHMARYQQSFDQYCAQ